MIKLTKFVPPDSSILLQIAEPIVFSEFQSQETKKAIEEMFETAYGEQKDEKKPLLVGLAAPQIGISKRIILVDVIADGKGKVGDLRLYLNPEIVASSEEKNDWYEGCYSTSRVSGIVSRPTRIKLEAYTKDGILIQEEYAGYTARIIQHEIDHLNGKVFIDHITDDEKLHWVEKEDYPQYRNQQAWRNWPDKCPRKKWEEIKGGNRSVL